MGVDYGRSDSPGASSMWKSSSATTAMQFSVALRAQSDQVQLGIIAGLTAKLLVVNFQVRHRAT